MPAEGTISRDELRFTFSRSSGPGGQKVNKTSTRVTLHFDKERSASLSPEQKAQLRRKLATRIDTRGILRVVSQKHRSQAANREEAVEHFLRLIGCALKPVPPRKPTRVPKPTREHRLREKARLQPDQIPALNQNLLGGIKAAHNVTARSLSQMGCADHLFLTLLIRST